ncbi:MAG: hypothetical protein CMI12_03975 [Oceanospirillum sp.]|nr:hypothetical protein [Oceanospirillum sp.]
MQNSKGSQLSFATVLFSVVVVTLITVVTLLLVPAYQGSQKALSEEINMMQQRDKRVLNYLFEQQLSNIARISNEITQSSSIKSSLLAGDMMSAQMQMDDSMQSQAGDQIDLLVLENAQGERITTTPFSFLDLDIDFNELADRPALTEQWQNRVTADGQSFLQLKLPIIHSDLGKVLGHLYVYVLLNDNFWILNEIKLLTGTQAVLLMQGNQVLAQISPHNEQVQLLHRAQFSNQPFQRVPEGIAYQYDLVIADQHFKIRALIPDTGLQILEEAYTGRLGISALIILGSAFIIFYFLRSLLQRSLHRLVRYAEETASLAHEQAYPNERFKEFARVGNAVNQMAQHIREREQRLSAVIQNAPGLVAIKGTDMCYQSVNAKVSEMTGHDEIIGKSDRDIFPKAFADFLQSSDKLVLETGKPCQYEMDLATPTGIRTYLTSKFPLLDEQRQVYAMGSIATDITEQRQNQRRLELVNQVFEDTAEGILVFDEQNQSLLCNRSLTELTGYEQEEAYKIARNLMQEHNEIRRGLIHHRHWQGEILQRRRDGSAFPAWVSISVVNMSAEEQSSNRYSLLHKAVDESMQQYIVVMSDISRLRDAEERLVRIANYDTVTNLPNRSLFFDRLEQSLVRVTRNQQILALLNMDINHFKQINEQHGHQVGDLLLLEVAQRVRSQLDSSATLSRINADEFLALVELKSSAPAPIEQLATTILAQFDEPISLGSGVTIKISLSMGIALYPNDGEDAQTLVSHADVARYHVKPRQEIGFQFYDTTLNAQAEQRLRRERDLLTALKSDDQLFMHYQAKYSVDGKRIIGTEALVRWIHPEDGFIPPDHFIPIAEENGSVIDLGRKVLQMSCQAAKQWQDKGFGVPVAVNLSPRQLLDSHLFEDIAFALESTGLPVELLELEITETVVIEDIERVITILQQLRDMGIRISVDDFGTGYSSLIYLKRLPVDTVKIDRSFLDDVPGDPDDESLIRAIITMSHSLGLQVISEGVETQEQQQFLQKHDCDELQGYLLSKPIPQEAFLALLEEQYKGSLH